MTRSVRFAVPLAALIGGGILVVAPPAARADFVFAWQPNLSIGYTDNARAATDTAAASENGDAITILSSTERLLYRAASSEHEFGYRLAYTHYLKGNGVDTTSHELAATSLFHLSAAIDLHLSATASLSRTSGVVVTAVGPTSVPQASVPGSSQFLNVTGGEEVTIEPTPRWRFVQGLRASVLKYVDVPIEPPTRTSVTVLGRVEHPLGMDTPLVEVEATDFVLTGGPPGTIPPTPDQSVFLTALAGWRREINPVWVAELRAGVTALIPSTTRAVYVPYGNGSIGYRRLTWYASLTASQEPMPNMFSGQATISDTVLAHVTLPVGKSEQIVVTGAGGYIYARAVDLTSGDLRHLYNQWTVLALVSYRFLSAPLFASLSYSFIDQTGMTDLRRQVVMLNLTGAFAWGPGTPPLFGGGGL